MPKIYCKHCNQPTDYSNNKPNFCCFCQKPFTASVSAFPQITLQLENNNQKPAPETPKIIKRPVLEVETYEESNAEVISDINLEIEPMNLARRKETLDNLIFDKSQKMTFKREKQIKGKVNKKQVLAEFQQETKSCKYGRQANSTSVE